MTILITGGAGFIGGAAVRYILKHTEYKVVNIDKLTYAGHLSSLAGVVNSSRYHFYNSDICDRDLLREVFKRHKPKAVIHMAAETHVDRSISHAEPFMTTNIMGTFVLLEATRDYLEGLSRNARNSFRFQHISTDEVFGDLKASDSMRVESSCYAPSSPYAASKASADHLVRAWGRTYNMPILISHCVNNYGPYQFPEKLIPKMIINAERGELMPLYGNGTQIRDWIYVDDHVLALMKILEQGKPGHTYNVGGHIQKTNIEVVETICDILDKLIAQKPKGIKNYRDLITFVADRPGHDHRYAIDATKIGRALGWKAKQTFESGLLKTIKWYLNNRAWWKQARSDG